MSLKDVIRSMIERTGYAVVNAKVLRDPQRQKPVTREDFFNLYFATRDPSDFFFVQVGANDGRTNDPIHAYVTKYGFSGIVIEPQPDVFGILERTYAPHGGVRCLHAAIAEESGRKPFYTIRETAKTSENFSRVTGIASFDKEVFLKCLRNKIPGGAPVEGYVQETVIDTLSFGDLARMHGISKIDMLQLDCEGYDYEILKTFDFDRFSPSLINLESMHLSAEDRESCERMLAERGYKSFRTVSDICAYRL